MSLSDLDRQLILIQQVGDVDPSSGDPILPVTAGSSGIVLQNAERIWSQYFPLFSLHPWLGTQIFDNYFKRGAVQLIIGVLESRVDFSAVGTALSVKLNQRIAAREMQLDRYDKQILRLESKLMGLAAPSVGLITRIEPITPPVPGELSSPLAAVGNVNVFVLDGNDPSLSGSPYWRRAMAPSTVR